MAHSLREDEEQKGRGREGRGEGGKGRERGREGRGREVSRCYSNAINQEGEREKNLIHRFLPDRHGNGRRGGDLGRLWGRFEGLGIYLFIIFWEGGGFSASAPAPRPASPGQLPRSVFKKIK